MSLTGNWAARVFLGTLALCVIGVLAAGWMGVRLPAVSDESVIARANCVIPCTFGIVPSITTRDEASTAAATVTSANQITQSGPRLTFTVADATGREVVALVTFGFNQNRQVSAISLFSHDRADIGQLGDLLLAGYTPNRAFRSCNGISPRRMLLTFGTGDRLIVEASIENGVTPDTPITLVEIFAPNARTIGDARASFGCSVETGWRGFAPLWRYYR